MGFKNFLRDYFTFNRRERNGVFILLSIILLLILYLSFSNLFFPKEKTDFSKFEKEISDFETEQKRITDSMSSAREKHFFSGNVLVSDSDSEGIPEKYYEKEKQYKHPQSNYTESKFPRKDLAGIIELNSADTAELKKLKGIGSGFAKRILKFRDVLGGFVKKEQLLEVYGFDKEKFDLISSQIQIDLSKVKKININSAAVDDLNKHPYIDKKTAVKIFWRRVNKGNYSDVPDILKDNLVDEELYSKIAPYLKAE